MKHLLFSLLVFALALSAQEWTFEGTLSDWTGASNLTATPTANGLDTYTTGMHSNIAADSIYFAPEERNYLLVEYQAEGVTTSASGYLFFGTAEDNRLDEEKKFYLPPVLDDGQPHEMLVSLKDSARANAFDIWLHASAITRLRMDLVADAGASVLYKSIRFVKLDDNDIKQRLFKNEIACGIPLELPVDMPNADQKEPPKIDASKFPPLSPGKLNSIAKKKPITVEIAQTDRGPIPMLDGKPCFFNMLTVHSYKDTNAIQTGMEGANSPFNVIAIRLGGTGNIWWVGPDKYDFTEVDKSVNMILQRYPDCMLGFYVWCQPGAWYTKAYPERMSRMEDGSLYEYYVSAIDFANQDYRNDAAKALTALVKHLEGHYGSRTFLYNLMGGISCEWQGWAAHSDQYADFSDGATREFLDYAAMHGVEATAVPRRAEREASLDGVFRSPAENAVAILYDQFYSESIAECVAQLATAVKNACNRTKLVGCYYGYLMEYANLGHCTNGGGHNALQRLLDCPDVDFFLSPQSYGIRSLGAPNADMKPYGAIYNAGKFSMLEDDTRTNMTFKTEFEQTVNLDCTLNVLKRNVGMSLAHGTPLNHLPLVGGNELDHPAIRQMFVRTLQGGQYLMENGSSASAEIAAVIDEEAIFYRAATRASVQVDDRSRYSYTHAGTLKAAQRHTQPITGDLLYYQRIPLAQFGAPVDMVLLDDILRNPAKYKMVIFLNAVKDRPELRQAIQLLRDNGAKIVFTYGTGFLDNQGISLEALSANVGMEMAEAGPGGLRVKFDADESVAGHAYKAQTRFKVIDENAVPIARYYDTYDVAVAEKDGMYFYGTTDLSREFLRMVAKSAGVHIFLEEDDNLYANRDIVSIHANHAGHKVIQLPRTCDVVDLYSGEVIAKQTTSFAIDMAAFETRVFLTGDAEKILPSLK